MNNLQRLHAYEELSELLEKSQTRAEVNRCIQIALEIESKHIEYIEELIEENTPDYTPVEWEQVSWK